MNDTPGHVIKTVREIMPKRPVTLTEAYAVAERQATKLLDLLDIHEAPVDVARLASLPRIDVQVEPRHRMPTLAGFSHWDRGRWLIVINRNNSPGRRRFTLAHEFKHVLDHANWQTTYANLGGGSLKLRSQRVEQLCDYFAACLLMPRPWVKDAWASGMQDVESLAAQFNVSRDAMRIRLTYLGFLDNEERPVESYFRHETRAAYALAA
jgi:Zn-dependent peptidase ImmA (M78 family)